MRSDLWSAEDEAILRCLYPDIGARGVQPLLSRHRALNAIMDKAAKMQVHRIGRADSQPRQETVNWVNGRRAELERLAGLDLSAAAIAERMGVTKNSVIGALSRNDDIYWTGRRNCRNHVVVTTLYNRLPEIDTDSCRWLDGEPREFRYCGKPVQRVPKSRHGESYCAEHRAIVWGAVPQGWHGDRPPRSKPDPFGGGDRGCASGAGKSGATILRAGSRVGEKADVVTGKFEMPGEIPF